MEVPNVPSGLTVNQLIENTRNLMKEKFIPYTASNNNCQNFILNVIRANNMSNPELEAFIKQDTSMIFKDPNFKKFSDGITGLGEKIDILTQGGKLKFHLSTTDYRSWLNIGVSPSIQILLEIDSNYGNANWRNIC